VVLTREPSWTGHRCPHRESPHIQKDPLESRDILKLSTPGFHLRNGAGLSKDLGPSQSEVVPSRFDSRIAKAPEFWVISLLLKCGLGT
jgi:hypothetical protein